MTNGTFKIDTNTKLMFRFNVGDASTAFSQKWKDKAEIYVDIICKKINISPPSITYNRSILYNSYYDSSFNLINIDLADCYKEFYIEQRTLTFINLNIDSLFKFFLFCLFHELAHCLQSQKFLKWTMNFDLQYKELYHIRNIELKLNKHCNELQQRYFDMKYRKLKREANADKIAIIWCKQYFPELFLE